MLKQLLLPHPWVPVAELQHRVTAQCPKQRPMKSRPYQLHCRGEERVQSSLELQAQMHTPFTTLSPECC